MENINFNELKERAYQIACEHGWHDEEYSLFHMMMLVITELGEAVNADRNNNFADRVMFEKNFDLPNTKTEYHFITCFDVFIKDTVEDELADAVIRLLDMAGHVDYDIDSSEFTDEQFDIGSVEIIGK